MNWEIERLLKQDTIEKKKAARGVFNRASRKGFIKGGVKTAYDFMSKNDKKKMNGVVKVYSKYSLKENIPTMEYIISIKDDQKRRTILNTLYHNFTVAELKEGMKCSQSKLYRVLRSNGINGKYSTGGILSSLKKLYNIEILPAYNSIKLLDYDRRRLILEFAKRNFQRKELSNYFKVSPATITHQFAAHDLMDIPFCSSEGISAEVKPYLQLDKLAAVEIPSDEKKESVDDIEIKNEEATEDKVIIIEPDSIRPAIEDNTDTKENISIKAEPVDVTTATFTPYVEPLRNYTEGMAAIKSFSPTTSNDFDEDNLFIFNIKDDGILPKKLEAKFTGLIAMLDPEKRYEVTLKLKEIK